MSHSSNVILDAAEKTNVFELPHIDIVKNKIPHEELYNRIDLYDSPSKRLKTFLLSIINPAEDPTHEAGYVRSMAFIAAVASFTLSGVLGNRRAHENYARLHNEKVFANQYAGNRHFYDTLLVGVLSKGWRPGLGAGLLCGAAGIIGLGSIVYRNKVYLPDFLVGFTTLGAISRCMLGTRGLVFGSSFGLLAGLTGYGVARSYEMYTGKTVLELRYKYKADWVEKVQYDRRIAQIESEKEFIQQFNEKLH